MDKIADKVAAYEAKLRSEAPKPPPRTAEDRAKALIEALSRTEVALDKADHKRIRLLLRACTLRADQGEFSEVYGLAAEICALARTRVLGVVEAHPVLSTTRPPPPPRLPSGIVDCEAD